MPSASRAASFLDAPVGALAVGDLPLPSSPTDFLTGPEQDPLLAPPTRARAPPAVLPQDFLTGPMEHELDHSHNVPQNATLPLDEPLVPGGGEEHAGDAVHAGDPSPEDVQAAVAEIMKKLASVREAEQFLGESAHHRLDDPSMLRNLQIAQAGFHIDFSYLKPLRTAVFMAGGLCSKMFGIVLVGYLAFQSMQANVMRSAQQQQQQQQQERQRQQATQYRARYEA